ncbi:GGDEF domain-containing protein [Solirubrobacter taibaiensis]|nr:GGDEF domain-containing protein [Solirubrobacter taibaiensis]
MERSVPPPSRRLLVLLFAATAPLYVLIAVTGESALHQAGLSGAALIATAVAVCGAARDRGPAQIAIAAGITLWAAGSVTATIQLAQGGYPTYPSLAEWLWLASYPAFMLAAMFMVPRWGSGHWRDGLVGCLAVVALGAAYLVPGLTPGMLSPLGTLVAGGFVLGDVLLIAAIGAALVIVRQPQAPQWRRLMLGAALLAGTDLLFAFRMAGSIHDYANWVDNGWVVGLICMALARPRSAHREAPLPRVPIIPVVSSVLALGLLVIDRYDRLPEDAFWIAVAAVALGVSRTVQVARAGARLAEAERLALTDELTNVGNRRRLFRDLGDAFEHGTATHLALFDLNGFKALNDSQGHAAGDALLADFGARLRDAVDGAGSAYRLGGDEFCVLLTADADAALQRARAALVGEGVTASSGSVLLGAEATDPAQALRLADARMYADKTRT